jgi:hypothetical protein
MDSIIQNLASEFADNWPAFLYIFATTVFSICFLRERRAEARIMKDIGTDLQDSIRTRFDRLEGMIRTDYSKGEVLKGDQVNSSISSKTEAIFR